MQATLFDTEPARRIVWNTPSSFSCSDVTELQTWLTCAGFARIAITNNPHETCRMRDSYGVLVVFYTSGTGLLQGNPNKREETRYLIEKWETEA